MTNRWANSATYPPQLDQLKYIQWETHELFPAAAAASINVNSGDKYKSAPEMQFDKIVISAWNSANFSDKFVHH